jgi:hypothetical protein
MPSWWSRAHQGLGRRPSGGHRPYTSGMYYGHATWITLVIFGGLFAMRALSSQRRRGRRSSQSPFVNGSGRDRPVGPPVEPSFREDKGATGVAPGWFVDPFGKHTQRYWSGAEWTEHVTDNGAPGVDPPPRHPGPRDAG